MPSQAAFNPVCRELGAPPRIGHRSGRLDRLSIPFAGSWGLRPERGTAKRRSRPLSIPFAGSWGLRHVSQLLGQRCPCFQSRLPGVGGSALVFLSQTQATSRPFNPVCRELGAPPSDTRPKHSAGDFQSRLPGVGGSAPLRLLRSSQFASFNPVCRELGAPPSTRSTSSSLSLFQSRLPGVGGSAEPWRAGGHRLGRLSIPFAGSWGLRLAYLNGFSKVTSFNPVCRELGAPPTAEKPHKRRLPFNPVCRELGAPPTGRFSRKPSRSFQSRLPGVGGSARVSLREATPPRGLSIPFAGSWGLRPAP